MAAERIGIYGGTFDPLHIGHLRIAEALVTAFEMDRLVFVPAHIPPHKRGISISSGYHRYAMIVLATQTRPKLGVSAIELEAPSRPYTIETLGRFADIYPAAQLFFVMGGDSFAEVNAWRDYGRIISDYRIIVAARPGSAFASGSGADAGTDAAPDAAPEAAPDADGGVTGHLTDYERSQVLDLRGVKKRPGAADLENYRIFLTDLVSEMVSATEIRQAAAQGQTIDHLVPPGVAGYVEKYGIYSGKHERPGND